MSRQAIHAMAQTQHIYKEYNDAAGNPLYARLFTVNQNLELEVGVQRNKARASAAKLWNGLIAAEKLQTEPEEYLGNTGLSIRDASYRATMALAWSYCGTDAAYGSENMALLFSAGRDIVVHALETEDSRNNDVARVARGCLRRHERLHLFNLAAETDEEKMRRVLDEKVCKVFGPDRLQSNALLLYKFTTADICINDNRNETMAERIARAIEEAEKPFVIVGSAHLRVGKTIVQLMRERGYTIRPVD
jgi:hypothetical protein